VRCNEQVVSQGRLQAALLGLNRYVEQLSSRGCDGFNREEPSLSFEVFCILVEWKELHFHLEKRLALDLNIIRDSLIKHSVDEMVAFHARLSLPDDLQLQHVVLRLLDPLVGGVILINALTIGVSADIAWDGWKPCEYIFTSFFLIEIVLKVGINGFQDHFGGLDWHWNSFDLTIVALAIADLTLTQIADQGESMFRDFTVVRMARLARLTRLMRLLRLLRLRIFKELMLMVKGVFAGLRTLFWAIVLLCFLVYLVAVLLRQTVGTSFHLIDDEYGTVLFGTMPWSMYNVFRMFLLDDPLANGTPLTQHLYHLYGPFFWLPYVLMILFINFGIFNLITAIFVENVTESAKQKRHLSREEDRVRVAQKLRSLILAFGGYKVIENAKQQRFSKRFSIGPFLSQIDIQAFQEQDLDWPTGKDQAIQSMVVDDGVLITRAMFETAIAEPSVGEIIDDLEIQIADRTELFDVLDADGSGAIDVAELIAGLMKLRSGGADKSDVVATVLGIRAIQNSLRDLQEETQELFRKLFEANGLSDSPSHSAASTSPRRNGQTDLTAIADKKPTD
jgi:hypothetical protein